MNQEVLSISESGGLMKGVKNGFAQVSASIEIEGTPLVIFSSPFEVMGLQVNGNTQDFTFTVARNTEIKLQAQQGTKEANNVQWNVVNSVTGCTGTATGKEFTCTPTGVTQGEEFLTIEALDVQGQKPIIISVKVVELGVKSIKIEPIADQVVGAQSQAVVSLTLDDNKERLSTNDSFFSDHEIKWVSMNQEVLSISESGGLMKGVKNGFAQVSASIEIEGTPLVIFSSPFEVMGLQVNGNTQDFTFTVARNTEIKLQAQQGTKEANNVQWNVVNSVTGCTGTATGKEFTCTPTGVTQGEEFLTIEALDVQGQKPIIISVKVVELGVKSIKIEPIADQVVGAQSQAVVSLTLDDNKERLSTNDSFFSDHEIKWVSMNQEVLSISESGGLMKGVKNGFAQVSASIEIEGTPLVIFSSPFEVMGLQVNGNTQDFIFTVARNTEIKLQAQQGTKEANKVQWNVVNSVSGCTGTATGKEFTCTPTEVTQGEQFLKIEALDIQGQNPITISIKVVESGVKSLVIKDVPALNINEEHQLILALSLNDSQGERLSNKDSFFKDHLITWQSSSDAFNVTEGGLIIPQKIGIGQVSATIKINNKNLFVFSSPIVISPGFSVNGNTQKNISLSIARNSELKLLARINNILLDTAEWNIIDALNSCSTSQTGSEFSCRPSETGILQIQALNPSKQENIIISVNVIEVGIQSMNIEPITGVIPQEEKQLELKITLDDGQGERSSLNDSFFTEHPIVWTSLAPEVLIVSPGGVVVGKKQGTAQIAATIKIDGKDLRVFSSVIPVLSGLAVNGHTSETFSFTHAKNTEIQLSATIGGQLSDDIQWTVLQSLASCSGVQKGSLFRCTPTESAPDPLVIRALNPKTQENIIINITVQEAGLKSMNIVPVPSLKEKDKFQMLLQVELEDNQGIRSSHDDIFFQDKSIQWLSSSDVLSIRTGGVIVAENIGTAQVSAKIIIRNTIFEVFSEPINVLPGFSVNGSTVDNSFVVAQNTPIRLQAKNGNNDAVNTQWSVVNSVPGCSGSLQGKEFSCTPIESTNGSFIEIHALDPETQKVIRNIIQVEDVGFISATILDIPNLLPKDEHQLVLELMLDDGQGKRLSSNDKFFIENPIKWKNLAPDIVSLSSGGLLLAKKQGVAQMKASIIIRGKEVQIFSKPITVLSGFRINGNENSFSQSIARNSEIKLSSLLGNAPSETTQWTVLSAIDGCSGSLVGAEFQCIPKATTDFSNPLVIQALLPETQKNIQVSFNVIESGVDSIRIQEVNGDDGIDIEKSLIAGDSKRLTVGILFNGSSKQVFSHSNRYLQEEGIQFSSTNENVLTVTQNGLIQAIGPGVAQVEVTFLPPETETALATDLFNNIIRRPVIISSDPIQVNPGIVVNGRLSDYNIEVFEGDTKEFTVTSPAGNTTIVGDSTLAGSSLIFDQNKGTWIYTAPKSVSIKGEEDELIFNTNQVIHGVNGQTGVVSIAVKVKIIPLRVETLQIVPDVSSTGSASKILLKQGEVRRLKLLIKAVGDPKVYEWKSGEEIPTELSRMGLPDWETDNSQVLTIQSGLIEALQVGDTTVTVTFGGSKAIMAVEVEEGFLVNNLRGSQNITVLTSSVQEFLTSDSGVTWSVLQNNSKGFNTGKITKPSDLIYSYTAGDTEGIDILEAKNTDDFSIIITIQVVKSAIESLTITDPINLNSPDFSMREGETKAFGVELKFKGNPTVFRYDGVNEQPNLFDADTLVFSSLTPGILNNIGGGSFKALDTGIGQVRLEMGSGTEFGNVVVTKFIDVDPGFRINGQKDDFSVNVFPGTQYKFNIRGLKNNSTANLNFDLFPSIKGGKGKQNPQTVTQYIYTAPAVLGARRNTDQLKVRNEDINEEILITIHTIPPKIEQVMLVKSDQNPALNIELPIDTQSSNNTVQKSIYHPLTDTPRLQEGDSLILRVNQQSISTKVLQGANLEEQAIKQLQTLQGNLDSIDLVINNNNLEIISKEVKAPFSAYVSIIQKGRLKVTEEEVIRLKLVALMEDSSIQILESGQLSHPIFGNPTWAIDNTDIATISESGQVRGLKTGFATVAVVVGSNTVDDSGSIIDLTPTYFADIEVIPAFAINGIYEAEELKKFEIFATGEIVFEATKNGNPSQVSWSLIQNQSGSSTVNLARNSTFTYKAGVTSDISGSIKDIIQVTDGNGKIHSIEIKVIPPVLEEFLLRRVPTGQQLTPLHAGDIMKDLELQFKLAGTPLQTIRLGVDTIPSVLGSLNWSSSSASIAQVDNGLVTLVTEGDVTLSVFSSLNPQNTSSVVLEVLAKQAKFIPGSTRITPSFAAVDGVIHIETELFFQDGIENIQEVNIQFASPHLPDARLKRELLKSDTELPEINLEEGEEVLVELPVAKQKQGKYSFDYQLPGEKSLDGKTIVYTITAITKDGASSSLDTQNISQGGTITFGSIQNICSPNRKLQCLIRGLRCLTEKSANNVSEECDQVISVFTNDPANFSIVDVFQKYKSLRK